MHIHSLAVVNIPQIQENEVENAIFAKELAFYESMEDQNTESIMRSIAIQELRGQLTTFSRAVVPAIELLMEPYGVESEDFYEFCDQTEDVLDQYENRYSDCIRLPDGRIVIRYDPCVCGKFTIHAGQVCQLKAGPLKHLKRTHKAKKMKAMPDYPFKKLYKTVGEFATDYLGYKYNEDTNSYGSYYNPNAKWDWYQIGGRWPTTFLVKDTCTEYSFGERSWGNEDNQYPCPEGYMWVSAARKKDIEWGAMKQWYLERAKMFFRNLEEMFVAGTKEPERLLQVKDGCVYSFFEMIYKIGESEEEYLTRAGVKDDRKYPVSFCDLIDENEWRSEGYNYQDPKENEKLKLAWQDDIQKFIDDLDDNDVLVSIDYHS